MTYNNSSASETRWAKTNFSLSFGLIAVLIFFFANGFIAYWNIHILSQNAVQVTRTHETIQSLDELISLLKDAETGQRGFVLTGDEKYLAPYVNAVGQMDEHIAGARRLLQDFPDQLEKMAFVERHIRAKMQELAETVDLRRTKGFQAALDVVVTDRGKNEMDDVRKTIAGMQQFQNDARAQRFFEMEQAHRVAVTSGIISALLGIILSLAAAWLMRRALTARQRQEWLQSAQVGLSKAMLGDQRLEQLGDAILIFLTEYLDAHAGAFFAKDAGSYRRIATYGISQEGKTAQEFKPGEGLLGQAARDGRTVLVRDVPEGYLTIGSALGHGSPRHLVISPALDAGIVNAVMELGFIHPINDMTVELLTQLSESIAIALRSANYRASLQNFLEETQRQAEELQTQSEELRVSNEELEEQSRALKESQGRLEQQQAELEQTNAQLEEQAQALEEQRDRLEHAKDTVEQKAQELKQASQYKSDFLANMSHELRTPLNSSLILAKLLADNPARNLTEEQVKFAQTIQSSGNDLLMLINDILDLSKIEAGHMELKPELVSLERVAHDMARSFEPMAAHKSLSFSATLSPGCPAMFETDRQRLEQVLKNLLSNAMKFTETGRIDLAISRSEEGEIVFAVTDTGIGIAQEQQRLIFEAFRQADGTISRKYGGTGLGLSISRELTRLLGGTIELKSKIGKGSTFSITLPEIFVPLSSKKQAVASEPMMTRQSSHIAQRSSVMPANTQAPIALRQNKNVKDDRAAITPASRVILVVEDDETFARILCDLIHELDFLCIVTHTAEEGMIAAAQYLPSAVVLDIGLPDNSGLFVLDRLKHDMRTRHIPVHVISAADHAQTALSLGAVGHMIKPVRRDELAEVLKRLQTKFTRRMRRVLIVEDDTVQRESMGKLLGSHDVETLGVGTAAECLVQLKESTFDCMVLDLSLPDASGYSLLETLSTEDAYSFPPVIVYTGRDLSADEEQKLRRYSKSIIIKGAKSPERLLDEVTLFLHQVVAELPPEQQRMLEKARNRDAVLENRHILIVEDDVRNVYALDSILAPRGATVHIARNGREALEMLDKQNTTPDKKIDLVLMDVMMPEMDGLTATREIRKRSEWKKLPVIMLTAKAMQDDQERCLKAGANDYMAKPLDVEKLLSLVRVWMPR